MKNNKDLFDKEDLVHLIKRIVQSAEFAKDNSEYNLKQIEELFEITTTTQSSSPEDRINRYTWLAGWSFGTLKSAIKTLVSIHKLSEELLDMSSSLVVCETDIDFTASKYNACMSDAIMSASESYNAHEEYTHWKNGDDSEKLYESVEHARDAIKSLTDALELLGCKREAENIRGYIEQGVRP